jgi:hypothetical protein
MNDFDPKAYQAFQEAMAERYDFKTCERKDGTTYGIPSGSDCGSGRSEVSGKKDKKVAMTPEQFNKAFDDANQRMQDRLKKQGHQAPATEGVKDLMRIRRGMA